jgi:hypothetical protein
MPSDNSNIVGFPATRMNNSVSSALLFSLTLNIGRNSAQDEDATAEVIASKEAQSDAGTFTKKFFPKESLKALRDLDGLWRRECKKLTVPWEGSERICTSSARPRVLAKCEEYAAKRNALKRDFIDNKYPELARNASVRLGKLYSVDDFPSAEDLEESICYKATFLPLPDAANIMVEGSPEELERLRLEARAEIQSRVAAGQADVWRRIVTPVTNFVSRLGQPDAIITQPSIDAIREIVGLIPALNLSNDHDLEEFRLRVTEQLTGFNASDVRSNPTLRHSLASKGSALMEKFGELGQRRMNLGIEPAAPVAQAVA